ncbi:MAG: 4Fe-4S dicluster domain-containing protein [Candidatus Lokiarchaeota archaeon]|nr:4Fe-4S dicluster domain-containing protein [Candidatus Lokiarchaeota archaeon]
MRVNSKIESILIYFFSGTGNTKRVTKYIADEFRKKNVNTDIVNIENADAHELNHNTYDIIGFGYPVHAFNAPEYVLKFIENIENKKSESPKKCFVFKTAGDSFMNGGSTHIVRKYLEEQGLSVYYERLFVMPANVLMAFERSLIKQLVLLSQKTARSLVEDILIQKERLQKNTWFNRISTKIFSKMESWGIKKLGKRFKTAQSCTQCGICEKICPTNNISIHNNLVKHGEKCMLCMRCIYTCPENAINIPYMNFFTIKKYDYTQKFVDEVVNDTEIEPNFLSSDTKGYFKHYYKFFKRDLENLNVDANQSD